MVLVPPPWHCATHRVVRVEEVRRLHLLLPLLQAAVGAHVEVPRVVAQPAGNRGERIGVAVSKRYVCMWCNKTGSEVNR